MRERGGAVSLVVCALALGLAPVLAGCGTTLDDLFHSDGQIMDSARRERSAATEPKPPAEKPEGAPPLPTREELHRRMLAILDGCVWANLRRPDHDVVEILPLEEHKQAWRLLVQGVRNAEAGLAVPGRPPDYFLLCEVRSRSGQSQMHMLLFKDGMLGSEESELGRMVRTIKRARSSPTAWSRSIAVRDSSPSHGVATRAGHYAQGGTGMTKSGVGRESHWPTLRGLLATALCVCGLVLVVSAGRAMACYPVAIPCAECSNRSSNNLYWSGTCGSARGRYNAGDGAVLTRVKYKIETRTLFDKTSGLGGQYYDSPWYVLSTTQWDHNTKMDFTAECWNNYDRYFKGSYWKYNDNYLYGYYNPTLHASAADCCQKVTDVCHACKHSGTAAHGSELNSRILALLRVCQVFYACTHSNGSTFQDSYGNLITPSQVANSLSQRTADDPGLNLVFLDACYSGTQTLYNGFTGGTPSTVQCYLGWSNWVPDRQKASNWTMVFWDELGKQKTVQDAKTAADNLYGLPATLLIFGSAGGLYRLHLTFG